MDKGTCRKVHFWLPNFHTISERQMKTDPELVVEGLTPSGITRYKATANEYCDELLVKAIAFGERDKEATTPREVTHGHVREAAQALQGKNRNAKKPLHVVGQVGEYLCTAVAGVGAGKLETSWGIAIFGIGLALAVILFIARVQGGNAT